MGIDRFEDGGDDPSQKAERGSAQGRWPFRGSWPSRESPRVRGRW